MKYYKLKTGFTLAEVLITLAIIGIVAAITIPTLIQNYQKKQLRAALKNEYAKLQEVIKLIYNDEGSYMTYQNSYRDHGCKTKLMKYLKVQDKCEPLNCLQSKNNRYEEYYNGYNKTNYASAGYLDDGQFSTIDNKFYLLECMGEANYSPDNLFLISVDVNGLKNPPNIWGKDLFTFEVLPDGRLLPEGAKGTKYEDTNRYCNGQFGNGCTYMALYSDDYWKNIP